jgi:hypothetical protein
MPSRKSNSSNFADNCGARPEKPAISIPAGEREEKESPPMRHLARLLAIALSLALLAPLLVACQAQAETKLQHEKGSRSLFPMPDAPPN